MCERCEQFCGCLGERNRATFRCCCRRSGGEDSVEVLHDEIPNDEQQPDKLIGLSGRSPRPRGGRINTHVRFDDEGKPAWHEGCWVASLQYGQGDAVRCPARSHGTVLVLIPVDHLPLLTSCAPFILFRRRPPR